MIILKLDYLEYQARKRIEKQEQKKKLTTMIVLLIILKKEKDGDGL